MTRGACFGQVLASVALMAARERSWVVELLRINWLRMLDWSWDIP